MGYSIAMQILREFGAWYLKHLISSLVSASSLKKSILGWAMLLAGLALGLCPCWGQFVLDRFNEVDGNLKWVPLAIVSWAVLILGPLWFAFCEAKENETFILRMKDRRLRFELERRIEYGDRLVDEIEKFEPQNFDGDRAILPGDLAARCSDWMIQTDAFVTSAWPEFLEDYRNSVAFHYRPALTDPRKQAYCKMMFDQIAGRADGLKEISKQFAVESEKEG